MLERSSKVQFNQHAKQHLAVSRANVKASNKRKRIMFSLQVRAGESARRMGKRGQELFVNYLPQTCVDLLKETVNWEKAYCYRKPDGYTVVNRPTSKEFKKLHTSFADMFIPDAVHVEFKCDESGDVQMKKDRVEVARTTG